MKKIEVHLYEGKAANVPDNLVKFQKWLVSLTVDVPDEYLNDVDIDFNLDWDDQIDISIYYQRPPTALEISENAKQKSRRERDAEKRDLEEFKRLKAKYEPEGARK